MDFYQKLHPLRSLILDTIKSHHGYFSSLVADTLLVQRISTFKEMYVKLVPLGLTVDNIRQTLSYLIGCNLVVFLSVPSVKNSTIQYESNAATGDSSSVSKQLEKRKTLDTSSTRNIDGDSSKFEQSRIVRTVIYSLNIEAVLGAVFAPLFQTLVSSTPISEYKKIISSTAEKEQQNTMIIKNDGINSKSQTAMEIMADNQNKYLQMFSELTKIKPDGSILDSKTEDLLTSLIPTYKQYQSSLSIEHIKGVFDYIITKGMASVTEVIQSICASEENTSTNGEMTQQKKHRQSNDSTTFKRFQPLISERINQVEVKEAITALLGLNFLKDFRASQYKMRQSMLAIYVTDVCNAAGNIQGTVPTNAGIGGLPGASSFAAGGQPQKRTFRDVLAEEITEIVSTEIEEYLHNKLADELSTLTVDDSDKGEGNVKKERLSPVFYTPNYSFLVGSVVAGSIVQSYVTRLRAGVSGEKVLTALLNLSGSINAFGIFPHLGIEQETITRAVSTNELLKYLSINVVGDGPTVSEFAFAKIEDDDQPLTRPKIEYIIAILRSLGVISLTKSDPVNSSWSVSTKLLKEQNSLGIVDRMIGERHGNAAMRILSLLRENGFMDIPKICELGLMAKDQALALIEKLQIEKFVESVQIPKTVDINPEMSLYVYQSTKKMSMDAARYVMGHMLQAIALRLAETQKKYEQARETGVERTKVEQLEKHLGYLRPVKAKVMEMILPILF